MAERQQSTGYYHCPTRDAAVGDYLRQLCATSRACLCVDSQGRLHPASRGGDFLRRGDGPVRRPQFQLSEFIRDCGAECVTTDCGPDALLASYLPSASVCFGHYGVLAQSPTWPFIPVEPR